MPSRMTNVPTSRVTPVSRRMLIGPDPVRRARRPTPGRGPSRRGGPLRSLGPCPGRCARRLVGGQPERPLAGQLGPAPAGPARSAGHRPQDRRGTLAVRGAEPLAPRAEMRRPRPDDDPLDRPSAARTRLAGPLVDLQVLLHRAVAVGRGVVVDRAAAPLDRLGQDPPDRVVEVPLVGRPQRPGGPQRMEPRGPQRLVGVDVADPGDERLVEQERLEPALPPAQPAPEVAHRERRVERLRTERREDRRRRRPRSTSSPVTGSRPYSPTLPNLRMSRKRSSRPSASSRTSRTYGSSGVSAGTTNSWPVIFRWIVSAASPDRSTTICLARRPTASTRRPATASANASGVCVRSVRAHEQRAPTIVAPTMRGRRSRATVSTSGSSGIART